MNLTQKRLKEVLDYCPALGLFWWKERPETDRHVKRWNTRYSGQIAGRRDNHGYGVISVDDRGHKAHRLAWLYMTGEWPPDDIDHANTWRLDNAFDNLRKATRAQNNANRHSINKTGLKGVKKLPSGRFQARIGEEYIGVFDTAGEAHEAAMTRARVLYGEFARA